MSEFPAGMTIHPEMVAPNGKPMRFIDLSARLPHLVVLAALAEETGQAAGATKLRGLGLPLPFMDDVNDSATLVRLWAVWAKDWSGKATLRHFEVRLGKERSGEKLLKLQVGQDGETLSSGNAFWYTSHRNYPATLTRLFELQRRLNDAAALAQSDDPLAALARQAVHEAHCAFCCVCGRTLTDPVSVQTGIGPECGASFQAEFLVRWKYARQREAA